MRDKEIIKYLYEALQLILAENDTCGREIDPAYVKLGKAALHHAEHPEKYD